MVFPSVEAVARECQRLKSKPEPCGRLERLLEEPYRIPEDLLLQALSGILGDIEEEARRMGNEGLAERASEARRDVEWALRESGW